MMQRRSDAVFELALSSDRYSSTGEIPGGYRPHVPCLVLGTVPRSVLDRYHLFHRSSFSATLTSKLVDRHQGNSLNGPSKLVRGR